MPVVKDDNGKGGITFKGNHEEDLGIKETGPMDLEGLVSSSPLDTGLILTSTHLDLVGSNEGSRAPKQSHQHRGLRALIPVPKAANEFDTKAKAQAWWKRQAWVHGRPHPVGNEVTPTKKTTALSPSSDALIVVKKLHTEVCSTSLAIPSRTKAKAVKQPRQSL